MIFSDHGESLGEDGYFGHGVSVVGRFTDVPLYVRYPGVTARRSKAPVSLTDIAPTVLHYLKQPIPGGVAGCSLLSTDAALERCPLPISTVHGVGTSIFDEVLRDPVRSLADLKRRHARVLQWQRFAPDVAITSTDYRYVFNLRNGSERLYRREHDPLEQHNLATQQPTVMRAFRARLAQWQHQEAQRIACELERARSAQRFSGGGAQASGASGA